MVDAASSMTPSDPAVVEAASKLTNAQRDDAAYERGWIDSLDAYDRASLVPSADRYWYKRGWDACADYRWRDRNGNGIAPDRSYRTPRAHLLAEAASRDAHNPDMSGGTE